MTNFKIIVDQMDGHVHFRIFTNGALAGNLCLRKDEFYDFIQLCSSAILDYKNATLKTEYRCGIPSPPMPARGQK